MKQKNLRPCVASLYAALSFAVIGFAPLAVPAHAAETCTTQSQMKPDERESLAAAAESMARLIEDNNQTGVRAATIAEFQSDFTGIGNTVSATAPHLTGSQAQVEQLYLLDASGSKPAPGGANPDAQFSCLLSNSTSEADFSIPQLPPGRYAFAIVRMNAATPWRLSMLLRQDNARWLLAGLYPKSLTADGHDGLWFWRQARTLGAEKQSWASWLYLQEARTLVTPASFITTTHLDKLQTELQAAAPPPVSNGISADAPLVVKAQDGAEFRITSLGVDDSLGLDVAAHIKVDAVGDPTAARNRNLAAAEALVDLHPELRKSFHGVWIFSDAPGKDPYGTEVAMSELK